MIGFVVAMQKEADILLRHMEISSSVTKFGRTVVEGKAFGKDAVLVVCGIGKVNAATGTEYLLTKYAPSLVVNFGVAGGLNDSMHIAGVYAISHSVEYDFDLTQLNGTPMGTLDEYAEPYLPLSVLNGFETKKLGTGDRFNDSKEDFLLLSETLRADIRDMEGGAVIHACYKEEVPVYSFKAISDLAGSGNTTEQYLANCAKALSALEEKLEGIVKALC
ncbi:MAG: 5'-methylthioadenosine/S-adenosylhomocysteine nucleosidase [Clostridia bacterium]|nr:5'-methylthioadenosine/S-adenosylhomocysteine nucleosidase [Clostridia bacterium]